MLLPMNATLLKCESDTIESLTKTKGIKKSFNELSVESQSAIIQYFVVEQKLLNDSFTPIDLRLKNINKLIVEAKSLFTAFVFYELVSPLVEVTSLIMKTKSNFAENHSTFKAYHDNYALCMRIPEYKSKWSLVAGCNTDGLLDGFHRLHRYYGQGDNNVTLVFMSDL